MHYSYEVMVRLTVRALAQPAIAICGISSIYYEATFIPGQLKYVSPIRFLPVVLERQSFALS